jgi:general nucleoside transport system permease protein
MERMSTATVDDELVITPSHELPETRSRRLGTGLFLVVLGVLVAVFLGLTLHGGATAHLRLGAIDQKHVPTISLPGRATNVVIGVLLVVAGAYQAAVGFGRSRFMKVLAACLGLATLAFFVWMSARGSGTTIDIVGLLTSTIALTVPLILGALAGIMCERSGVINVAIEGQMLFGAWSSALIGSIIGSQFGSVVGILAGALAGALMGLMLAVFAIRYLVNQVVLGVVLNVFAAGMTGYLYDAFMQPHSETLNNAPVLNQINIPLLSDIPVIGPLFFQANLIVYLAYVLIVLVDIWLFRTRWGLRTRAVGEHPKAADTVGIKVLAMRYRNVVIGGAIAGIGGAYFTVGSVGQFQKNITVGDGFIALAAVIFGRWSPIGALGASLLFGFTTAAQPLISQYVEFIPANVVAMLPYLATIVAVAGLIGKVRAPAADGEPYVKG